MFDINFRRKWNGNKYVGKIIMLSVIIVTCLVCQEKIIIYIKLGIEEENKFVILGVRKVTNEW